MKSAPDTFAARVLRRRTALGLSQGKLGVRVGMKQQGIQAIEEGKSQRPRRLPEIAAALETTIEWLLDGVGPEVDPRVASKKKIIERVERLGHDELIQLDAFLQRMSKVA